MKLSEVSQKSREQLNVSLWIEHVLVSQLLRTSLTNCLPKRASAITPFSHQLVANHATGHALQILHLVSDQSAIKQLNQPSLDRFQLHGLSTRAEPHERHRVTLCILHLRIVQVIVTADVHICALKAGGANDVWEDEDQGGLLMLSGFVRELFDLDKSEKVSLQVLSLQLKRRIQAEDMLADHLRVLKGRIRVRLERAHVLRELPSLQFLLTTASLTLFKATLNVELS